MYRRIKHKNIKELSELTVRLDQGYGHVYAQVAIVGEQLRNRRVEHQAVRVVDRRGHTLMDRTRHGLPGESSSIPVQLQAVHKVLRLLARSDQLNDGKELLVAVVLLLLLQHEHEMVAKAGLHHHPVNGAGQVYVGGQEHDILALQRRDALVRHHQMLHD